MSNSEEALRLSADDRREQILKVAASHLAREGHSAASVRAIAEEAGVTRALVYHYFPGKEALLEAVLRQEADALLAATAPVAGLSPQENLQRALGRYLDHFSASGGEVRQLYAPPPVAPALLADLADANHLVQVQRIRDYLDLPDTPRTRLAIKAWLSFVTEAAREQARGANLTRPDIIRLCMQALHAVTGASSAAGPSTQDTKKAKP